MPRPSIGSWRRRCLSTSRSKISRQLPASCASLTGATSSWNGSASWKGRSSMQRGRTILRERKKSFPPAIVRNSSANRPRLEPRFENADRYVREQYAALTEAAGRVEAIGGDDAVARLEQERRVVLLEIEDRARQYMRLRAGTIAAETALRTYRERHRSSMMERASKAFATISRGDYTGLSTRPDGDSELLIAQAADGGSKLATEMSRGTRFQLYLALRMAGLSRIRALAPTGAVHCR